MAKGAKTGGRKAGTPNKATADIKAAAAVLGPKALQVLIDIATDDEKPAASRVAAAVALLDRGFGKPAQAITDPDGNAIPGLVTVYIPANGR